MNIEATLARNALKEAANSMLTVPKYKPEDMEDVYAMTTVRNPLDNWYEDTILPDYYDFRNFKRGFRFYWTIILGNIYNSSVQYSLQSKQAFSIGEQIVRWFETNVTCLGDDGYDWSYLGAKEIVWSYIEANQE